MAGIRDYVSWHDGYDDPGSGQAWRLRTVQGLLAGELDRRPGPVRVLSVCAGDGRDVLEVLAGRGDAARVTATLLEIHPELVEHARALAARTDATVEVRAVDAGTTDAYAGAAPADLVLLVGIFGNISDDDVRTTVTAAPQLCRPGATLLWSRGREREDLGPQVRRWFVEAGFTELGYATHDAGDWPALGSVRYDGPPRPLVPAQHLFTFRQ